MEKLLVAIDVGGTNCRFGLFSAGAELELLRSVWLRSADMADTAGLLGAVPGALDVEPGELSALAVAIAGPVRGHCGYLSNGSLRICLDPGSLPETLPAGLPCALINDFTAQALASLGVCGASARHVAGPQKAGPQGPRAVIGAGTGLGQALLTPCGGKWRVLPSEGGHAAFPFVGALECAFQTFLCRELGLPYARGDDVLTGRGLVLLHRFLTGEKLSAAEVGSRALGAESATLAHYSRFYARACRNLMLSSLCLGGMWIAGGIAAQNPYCLQNSHFQAELKNCPRGRELLDEIPLRLMTDRESGLWGTAEAARELL